MNVSKRNTRNGRNRGAPRNDTIKWMYNCNYEYHLIDCFCIHLPTYRRKYHGKR
jgi:hypothetical protein